jgi:hypothetical protein
MRTNLIETALKNVQLLNLTVYKYKIISDDISHNQFSASFHDFESDVVSNFNPGKTNTRLSIYRQNNIAF